MNEDQVKQIVRDEISKNTRSGSPITTYHTHDGINSPKISQSSLVEFLALPTDENSVRAFNNISGANFIQTFDGNRNVYTLPLVIGGLHGDFNGGNAPDGTLIGISTGGQQQLALCIDNTWYTASLNGIATPTGLHGMQTFTSGGTFTVPAGVTKVWIRAVGGGKGGTAVAGGLATGASGVAGDYVEDVVDVTGLSTVTVTIGANGSGDTGTGPTNGGDTSFGSLVVAKGGGSATASVGSVIISNMAASPFPAFSFAKTSTVNLAVMSSAGGSTPFGFGGVGSVAAQGGQTNGGNAQGYGGGGSGAASGAGGGAANGGNGGGGLLLAVY